MFAVSHLKREYSAISSRFQELRGFPVVEGACFTAANDAAYAFISLAKDMLEHMEDREHAHSAALALTRKQETLISTLGQDLQLAVSRLSRAERPSRAFRDRRARDPSTPCQTPGKPQK